MIHHHPGVLLTCWAFMFLVGCSTPQKDPCAPPQDSARCIERQLHRAPKPATTINQRFGDCSSHDLINFSCDD